MFIIDDEKQLKEEIESFTNKFGHAPKLNREKIEKVFKEIPAEVVGIHLHTDLESETWGVYTKVKRNSVIEFPYIPYYFPMDLVGVDFKEKILEWYIRASCLD